MQVANKGFFLLLRLLQHMHANLKEAAGRGIFFKKVLCYRESKGETRAPLKQCEANGLV